MPISPFLRRQRPAGTADHRVAELHAARRPASRSPPPAAAAWSCRSRTDRAARRIRRRRCRGSTLSTARVAPNRFDTASKRHARHGTTPSGRLRASEARQHCQRQRHHDRDRGDRRGGRRIALVVQEEDDDAERLAAGRPEQHRNRELVERGHEDQQRAGRRRRRHRRQDHRAQPPDARRRRRPARPRRDSC